MGKTRTGYGVIHCISTQYATHRVVYELAFGKIPNGMCICHTCDNPKCVNPDHLFLGTDKINALDKIKKNRHNTPHGSSHVRAKLDEDKVKQIKILLNQGEKLIDIANLFGVKDALICKIKKGTHWKHVSI